MGTESNGINTTLNELLKEKGNEWMLQILVDNLAISESIPLRLVIPIELENLYHHFYKSNSEKFKNRFKNKNCFDDFCIQLVAWSKKEFTTENTKDIQVTLEILSDLYDNFSDKIFPILPANLHSVEFLAQTVISTWRIYSVLWVYNALCLNDINLKNSKVTVENAYGIEHFDLIAKSLKSYSSNSEVILLAGPVFITESETLLDEELLDETISSQAQEKLLKFAKTLENSTHVRESYFRQAINLETVFHQYYVNEHIDIIYKAWDLLLKTQINLSENPTRKWIRVLVLWSLYICELQNNSLRPKFSSDTQLKALKEKETINIILRNDEACFNETGTIEYLTKYNIKDNTSDLTLCMREDNDESIEPTHLSENKGIGRSFLRYYRVQEQKSKRLDISRLFILELWINGIFSALTENNYESIRIKEQLIAWICAALRADISEIIDYLPHDIKQTIQVQNIFTRKKIHFPKTELKRKLQKLSPSLQKDSNIYNVVTKGKSKICFNPDPACPTGSNILNYAALGLSNVPNEKSEIVVPIKFNNRVLGAIEIAAFTPWRFGFGHRNLLFNIVTKLGAFWYQVRYFNSLKQIQKDTLEFYMSDDSNDKKLFNKICQQAAVLYLATGAGLWIKELGNGKFMRKGFHNVSISNDVLEPDNPKQTLLAETIKKAEDNDNGDVLIYSQKVTDCDALDPDNRLELEKTGITDLLQIPIQDSNGHVIAILSIYDKSDKGFDSSWKYISQFFSSYLNVIISSTQSYINNKINQSVLFEHELRDAVGRLVDKSLQITSRPTQLVNELDTIISALTNQTFVKHINQAKRLNDLPSEFRIKKLRDISHSLKSYINLPREDIKAYSKSLHHRISAIDPKFLKKYKTQHRLEVKNLIALTGEPAFVDFMVTSNLLGLSSLQTNLRQLVLKSVSRTSQPKYLGISPNLTLDIKKDALEHVIRNLWENARKYRTKPSDTINIEAEILSTRALKLTITNPCHKNTEKELKQLTRYAYQAKKSPPLTTGSPNQGLGLYITDQLCRHVLNISFSIQQETRGNITFFIATLLFNRSVIYDN